MTLTLLANTLGADYNKKEVFDYVQDLLGIKLISYFSLIALRTPLVVQLPRIFLFVGIFRNKINYLK